VTVAKAVGGEVPSEPKNSGAIAMAPQFLASHPQVALPSEGLRVCCSYLYSKKIQISHVKRLEVARGSEKEVKNGD
jgi:hypothetical protein